MRTTPRARVLVVDDEASLRRIAEFRLEQAGYEVVLATDGEEGLDRFEVTAPDLVVTDLRMPGLSGEALLSEILRRAPGLPVVVVTGHGSVEGAVAAMREGVADYVTKPVSWDELLVVVARELDRAALRRENERLRSQLVERHRFEGIVGESAAMQGVFETLTRLKDADATVLLQGESGTGKELAARALHFSGRRAEGPFVAVNCGALPRDLIGSQLFGHEAGAFTGATARHRGFFEQAHGGTLFLDEVGEIPLDVQASLLRVLTERRVGRLGSEATFPVDVRLVAATNRDLAVAVEEGEFRQDLYFRLAVVPVRLPPLRERGDDVLLLARHFADEFAGDVPRSFTDEAPARLREHAWPGNVRELRNAVERAVLLTDPGAPLRADDLLPAPRTTPSMDDGFPDEGVDLADIERDWIRRALRHTDGNRTRAARLLGISRQTLLYRIAKYGLESVGR